MVDQEIVFKPKYRYHPFIMFIIISILVVMSLNLASDNPTFYLATIFFGLLALSLPFNFVREIRIKNNVEISRYLLPKRLIEFSAIKDIGATAIKIEGQHPIAIAQIRNKDELLEIIEKLIQDHKIQHSQIEGRLIKSEALSNKALKISVISIIIISIVAELAIQTFFNVDIDFRITLIIVFIIIYLSVYNFLKWKAFE